MSSDKAKTELEVPLTPTPPEPLTTLERSRVVWMLEQVRRHFIPHNSEQENLMRRLQTLRSDLKRVK